MKEQYRYYVVGKLIVRIYAWHVSAHPGLYRTYIETDKVLFDRAEKYGYKAWALE